MLGLIGLIFCIASAVRCDPSSVTASVVLEDDLDSPLDKLYHIREKIHETEWRIDDTEELHELLEEYFKFHGKLNDGLQQVAHLVYTEMDLLSSLIQDTLVSNCAHERFVHRPEWSSKFDDYKNLKALVDELNAAYYANCKQKCNLLETRHDKNLLIRAVLDYVEPRMPDTPISMIFEDLRVYRSLFLRHVIDLQSKVCTHVEGKSMQTHEDFEIFLRQNEKFLATIEPKIANWMQHTNICQQLGVLEHHKLFNRHIVGKVDYNKIHERLVNFFNEPPHTTRNLLELMSIFRSNGFISTQSKRPFDATLLEDSPKLADQSNIRTKCSYESVKEFLKFNDLYQRNSNLRSYFEHYGKQILQFCKNNLIRDIRRIIHSKITDEVWENLFRIRGFIERVSIMPDDHDWIWHRCVQEEAFVQGLSDYLRWEKGIELDATDQPNEKELANLEQIVKDELEDGCSTLLQNINSHGLYFSELVKLDLRDNIFDRFTQIWMGIYNICSMFQGKHFKYQDLYALMTKNWRPYALGTNIK